MNNTKTTVIFLGTDMEPVDVTLHEPKTVGDALIDAGSNFESVGDVRINSSPYVVKEDKVLCEGANRIFVDYVKKGLAQNNAITAEELSIMVKADIINMSRSGDDYESAMAYLYSEHYTEKVINITHKIYEAMCEHECVALNYTNYIRKSGQYIMYATSDFMIKNIDDFEYMTFEERCEGVLSEYLRAIHLILSDDEIEEYKVAFAEKMRINRAI